jgi:protein TonB
MWPEFGRGTRGSPRLAAALAVSLVCHAAVLALARGWESDPRPATPLVVTMLERGGEDADAGARGGSAVADAAFEPAPVAMPAAVAAPRPKRAVVPPAARAPHASVAERPSADTAVPSAAEDAAGPASAGVTASAGTGGTGTAAAGTGPGAGRGSGAGTGADGLRALCERCPAPEYPSRARRQGWQGTVDVALTIGGDGAVADARVERSSGYPALDDVALDVARQSRFAVPAGGDGLRGQLRYRFVLDATAARR